MKAAPPIDCHCCQRQIGKTKTHLLIPGIPGALCVNCLNDRRTHGRYFPNCTELWHDMHDHGPAQFATRAAASRLLRDNRERNTP
jgi:hypothetical protein